MLNKILFKKELEEMDELRQRVLFLEKELKLAKSEDQIETLMRVSLGLPTLDFWEVDEEGKPPHYLSGLTEVERKNFISDLESIYSNDKFQKVVAYTINLLGNHAIQKAPEDKMRNGRIGIIGIRTLMAELEKMHNEFQESRKPKDEFDEHEIL